MIRVVPSVLLAATALFQLSACALEQPLSGPGYENGELTTKAEGPFFVSATHLNVKDNGEANASFDENMKAMQEALTKQPGLVAFGLSTVPMSNDEQRTLSVWESEADMLAWVISEPHAKAMSDFVEHAESGITTHWQIERKEMPPTWQDARDRLDAEGREAY